MSDLINFGFYLDLLERFKHLKYREFPLVYFLNIQPFFNIINEKRKTISNRQLELVLKNKINEKKELQIKFDQITQLREKPSNFYKKGKVALYDELNLRFTDNVYLEYFDPETTVIVRTATENKEFLEIPIHNLENDTFDNVELNTEIEEKARRLFLSFKDHPIFGHRPFQAKFFQRIRYVISWIGPIIKFFEKMDISCLVVGGAADEISRMLILIGASKGIPSVCLQHGMMSDNRGWVPTIASKDAVYGIHEKEFLMSWGVPSDCIEITGHPKYDRIFTESHMSKMDFCKITGISPYLKTVLIATQPGLWSISRLREIIKYLNDYKIGVIIKPHPTEIRRGSFIAYKALENKIVKVVESEIHLHDIIQNVNVVCVDYSTVGLEAALLGKPVVYATNKVHDGANYSYTKYLAVPNLKKLAYIIRCLIVNRFEEKNITDYRVKVQEYKNSLVYKAYPEQLAGKNLSDLIYKLSGIKSYIPKKELSDGMMIKGSSEKVYLIQNGMKRQIQDHGVFTRLALDMKNVHIFDDDFIKKIPSGIVLS